MSLDRETIRAWRDEFSRDLSQAMENEDELRAQNAIEKIALCDMAELSLQAPQPEGLRNDVLDEIEKLIGAAEGRHFKAIGTAATEEDRRRHGTKAAFAMELRAAIRALKTPSMNNERS
jgi:hypothetical protein